VANNRRIMGGHTNGWLSNLIGAITLAALAVAAAVAVIGFLTR